MSNYTYAQLEGLWIQNGGSAATAPIAAAIAEAESSGNPSVTSSNPDGGTNVGLWQIDTNGVGKGLTVTQLTDPDVNASAAIGGSTNGNNWSDWATYASGAYKAFLSNSTTPDTSGLPISANTVTSAAAAAVNANICVIPYPTLNLVITTVGGGCILTKSQARAMIGGACLAVAGVIALAAAVILAASAFEHSGAAAAITKAAGPVGKVAGALA